MGFFFGKGVTVGPCIGVLVSPLAIVICEVLSIIYSIRVGLSEC